MDRVVELDAALRDQLEHDGRDEGLRDTSDPEAVGRFDEPPGRLVRMPSTLVRVLPRSRTCTRTPGAPASTTCRRVAELDPHAVAAAQPLRHGEPEHASRDERRAPAQATTSSRMPRTGGGLVSDLVRAEHGRDRRLGRRLVPRMDVREHLAGLDRLTPLRAADDADGVIDLVVLRATTAAELEARDADRERREARDDARPRRHDLANDGRPRQRVEVGISALGANPALVHLASRPVGQRLLRSSATFDGVDAEIGQRQKPRARIEDELREVRRPLSHDRVDRLPDLERVSDGGAEGLVHVGQQADDVAPGPAAEIDHLLREDARVVDALHERAVADLHVEHDRLRAGSELLRHDRGGDERHDVDGRRDVAQRIELLVGRDEISRLADDRDADLAHLREELLDGQLDAEAGYRLELVERSARVAEAAPRHLPERNAAGGDDGADRERGLVADASRRVLVDDPPAERRRDVDRVARTDHRVGQGVRLLPGEPLVVDGHAPRGHLVVGDVAARVAEDELRDLLLGELSAVPLALDQLGCANRHADDHARMRA